jgi:sugar lactone lactonase YvrE
MGIVSWLITATCAGTIVRAQRGAISPLARPCDPDLPSVICINQHAAVMPYPFERTAFRGLPDDLSADAFERTIVANDESFELTRNASFIVFDEERGLKILGPKPTYQNMFRVRNLVHEGPVYIPSQNKIIFSEFSPRFVPPLVIDLNESPPTLSNLTTDPPVYGINGGKYYQGRVYWTVSGLKQRADLPIQGSGIVTLDPTTNQVATLLNNYFGTPFNSPNDLIHTRCGDIFFTDGLYGYQQNISTRAAALQTAVYRFRPSTGAVQIVDTGLVQPNGIALSPDEKTLYVADSGAGYSTIYNPPGNRLPPLQYNSTSPRVVYAYDTRETAAGKILVNRRPIWLTQEFLPDGIKVARNGYLLVSAGAGYVFLLSLSLFHSPDSRSLPFPIPSSFFSPISTI